MDLDTLDSTATCILREAINAILLLPDRPRTRTTDRAIVDKCALIGLNAHVITNEMDLGTTHDLFTLMKTIVTMLIRTNHAHARPSDDAISSATDAMLSLGWVRFPEGLRCSTRPQIMLDRLLHLVNRCQIQYFYRLDLLSSIEQSRPWLQQWITSAVSLATDEGRDTITEEDIHQTMPS